MIKKKNDKSNIIIGYSTNKIKGAVNSPINKKVDEVKKKKTTKKRKTKKKEETKTEE